MYVGRFLCVWGLLQLNNMMFLFAFGLQLVFTQGKEGTLLSKEHYFINSA